MGTDSEISKLLSLKRYEQPPPGYFEDFLREFQRRQRAELMRRSLWERMWERLNSFAPAFRVPQFAYATILVVAAVASTMIVTREPASSPLAATSAESSNSGLSLAPSSPVTIGETLPVSARADGSLPPHYVLQPQPVKNERPLSF